MRWTQFHINEVPEPQPTQNVSRDILSLGVLELLILLRPPPECWDDRMRQVYAVLRMELRALRVRGKYPIG